MVEKSGEQAPGFIDSKLSCVALFVYFLFFHLGVCFQYSFKFTCSIIQVKSVVKGLDTIQVCKTKPNIKQTVPI